MYFIRYQPLKDRLRSRSVSDREALPYLVLFAALTALVCSLPTIESYNFWDGVSAVLSVATAIGGILYAYRQNGGMAGFDLIQKYVILGWVVFVRFLIVFLPAALVLVIVGAVTGLMSLEFTGPYDVVMIFSAEVIFYQRLGKHVGDTAIDTSKQ
jgi:hypothetical protein